MVRKASSKTLWAMSVNQIEDRIDRLQKEAGAVFRDVQKCKSSGRTSTKKCRDLLKRRNNVSKEIKRTTDIAKITRHHARINAQRKKLRAARRKKR